MTDGDRGMIHAPDAARTAVASNVLAAAGLLALIGCAWRLAAAGGGHDIVWVELTAAATVGGFAALGWLRSARVGVTAPQIMLLLGAAGMVAGLAYDAHAGGFAALASVCLAGPGDLLATLRLHWQQLPAMHLGMIAGGLTTVPLLRAFRRGCRRQFCARLVQNLACSAWMVLGMSAGTLVFLHLAALAGGRSPAAMLGGMFGGMVWGMVVSVSVYRLWFRIADGRAAAPGRS
jgi:hypothetical protein